ncbi:MAG TPA: hypothetical protein VMH05_13170 [Bryobacteraceae bacterium]|nr:hypothetical protein [Bryobacteraceae bacterium]
MQFNYLWRAFYQAFLPCFVAFFLGGAALGIVARLAGIRPRGGFSLITAFAFLGGILGYSSGNSREPAIVALSTGMITVSTFIVGYVFSKDAYSHLKDVMPYCLLAMLLLGFFGLFAGSYNRRANDNYYRELAIKEEAERTQRLTDIEIDKWKRLKDLGISPTMK